MLLWSAWQGAKLQYGGVPLYAAGDNSNARQFRSLHAVQRHMVDSNRCRMLYEGNEEEYEDFYDYEAAATTAGKPGVGCRVDGVEGQR